MPLEAADIQALAAALQGLEPTSVNLQSRPTGSRRYPDSQTTGRLMPPTSRIKPTPTSNHGGEHSRQPHVNTTLHCRRHAPCPRSPPHVYAAPQTQQTTRPTVPTMTPRRCPATRLRPSKKQSQTTTFQEAIADATPVSRPTTFQEAVLVHDLPRS